MGLFDLLKSGRGPKIKEIAPQLDCTYAEEDEFGLYNSISDFHLFRKGSNHRLRNILSKEERAENLRIHIFDHQYIVHTAKSRTSHEQSIMFFDSRELGLPRFVLEPDSIFDPVSSWIGFEDIDFPDHPGFSGRYYLKGDVEQLIRHTFQKNIVKYFASHPGWSVEGHDSFLIAYIDGTLQDPDGIGHFLEKGLEIDSLFKRKRYNG